MQYATLDSKLPQLIEESEAKARIAVETACASIDRRAKEHSRVDTGLMRSSWEYEILSDTEGRVFNLVRYAVYNEYGTRYMAAAPMLRPAIVETTPEFEALVAEIYSL